MIKKKQNIMAMIVILGFLVSTIFGCIMASQSSLMMHNNSSSHLMACCDESFVFGNIAHNTPFIVGANSNLQLLLLVTLAIFLFVSHNTFNFRKNLNNYFKIRERYGGFNLFYYLASLFSKGILHPKIY